MIDAVVIGLIESAPLVLAAVGFTLIYYLNGFINVAYAETITVGAYTAVVFNNTLGWSVYASMVPAALLSGVFSVVTYLLVFRPALNRGVGPVEMIVLSVGLSFFIRHALRVGFGLDSYQYDLRDPSYLSLLGTGITSSQIISLLLVAAVAVLCYVLIYRTPHGGQIRAFASNKDLARVSGINPHKVAVLVWFLGGVVGGLAGVFTGTFAFVDYELGWDTILVLIMVAIIGGVGSVRGALIAGLVVGIVTSVISLWTQSPIYAQVALLALFVVVLRLRKVGVPGGVGRLALRTSRPALAGRS
jgi:branched-subunit amino acid ABC-type transport system permease component